MIIDHPLLGPRDISEFIYLGDASLLNRPKWDAEDAEPSFYEYLYLRKNVAGIHKELWFHQQGDRSWLVISRNTLTHEIIQVDLVRKHSKNTEILND
jgi:sarcosine oxidase subunit delta